MTRILAVDIGGTTTRLRLTEFRDGQRRIVAERRYDSAGYPSFDAVLGEFLTQQMQPSAKIDAACFGVAGPVFGRLAQVTNLPWRLDADALQQQFGLAALELVNDFEAVGYGIDAVAPENRVCLQVGNPVSHGVRAIIGAGTGLGEALLIWQDGHYRVFPSQGGHVNFAPLDAVQDAMLAFFRAEFGPVSYERVVSGPGLENIHRYLQFRQNGIDPLPQQRKTAPDISAAARTAEDALAVEAVRIFLQLYGSAAGNLALTALARGGVYLAGGIAPQLKDLLAGPDFLRAFQDKGPMQSLMQEFFVCLITDTEVGLLGAEQRALLRAG